MMKKMGTFLVYPALTRNHMIFLVQFGINKHSLIFQRPQIALALRASDNKINSMIIK